MAVNAVLVGLALGVLLGGLQIGLDLLNERQRIRRTVHEVMAMVRQPAAKAAYEIDASLGRGVMEGLFQYRPVVEAQVVDDFGTVLAHRQRPLSQTGLAWLTALFFDPQMHFSLPLFYGERRLAVGRLELTVDGHLMAWDFLNRAGVAALVGGVYALVMALFLSLAFHLWVTRPLARTVDRLAGVDPAHPSGERLEPPPGHRQDELGSLVESLNQLLAGFRHSLERRRRAEADLRRSEQRFRSLAESIREVFWLYSPESGRLLYLSPAFRSIWGRSPEEALANPEVWFQGVHPDDRSRVRRAWAGSLAAGEYDEEYRVLRPDGEMRWVYERAFPVADSRGRVQQVSGIAVDITERKEAEEALRQSSLRIGEQLEEMDQLYRFAPVGLCVLDRDLKVQRINQLLAQAAGRPVEDCLGRELTELGGPMGEEVRETAGRVLASGEPLVGVEIAGAPPGSPDERRWWLASIFPLRSLEGEVKGLMGAALEITERKRGEEERRRLESQMQHTQKLESLGLLAGGIAHDFNNLLMGVMGNAGLALMQLAAENPARPWVEQIQTAAQRLAELTNQLLAYSGKGKFVARRIDLNHLVREMGDLLRTVVSKNAAVSYRLDADDLVIEADATQMRQVVMNLITNASEALGEAQGLVTISTGRLAADSEYLDSTLLGGQATPGGYAYLEVSDTGCGMDQETQSRIFEPFFTTKFTGRGMGLGAVLGIVRGHHGALKVYSEPGRGTTVKVLLPLCRRPAEEEEDQDAVQPPPAGEPATVLVVDDEEMVRELTRASLEQFGFTVLSAADGQEGVELFAERADEVDLVLLDMTMPRMGGEEAFRELRKLRPRVPVILSSGYNEQDATARFAGKGLAGFIQKPYRPSELLARIREALTGRE
jgi:PAS domain S-box-containing protein